MSDADDVIVSLERVTLAVLAGGLASRMGRAKALLSVGGRPILGYLLDRLEWPGPTMLVTAPGRERPPGFERFDREVCDAVAGEGPLRGVHTALEHLSTDSLVITAVDMPGVTRDDLRWYAQELAARPQSLGVMGSRGGAIEPLPCAMRAAAIDVVSAHLAEGRRSLHRLADDPRVNLVDAGELPERVWLNVNTPDDWERFLGGQGE